LADSSGHFTVQATCLEVSPGIGGRVAGAGGKIVASTEPGVPVGDGVLVGAFDTATSSVADEIATLVHAPGGVPAPNQCTPRFDTTVPVAKGNIIVRQGS
jgi:hypothetical protein